MEPQTPHTTTFVTVRLEDKPGTLGKLCRALAQQDLNIERIEADNGQVRLLASDVVQAERCLRDAGFAPQREDVVEVQAPDQPGQLAALCEALGQAGVNINGLFGVTPGGEGRLFVRVKDVQAATKALAAVVVPVVQA